MSDQVKREWAITYPEKGITWDHAGIKYPRGTIPEDVLFNNLKNECEPVAIVTLLEADYDQLRADLVEAHKRAPRLWNELFPDRAYPGDMDAAMQIQHHHSECAERETQLAAANERGYLRCFGICDGIARGCFDMDHPIRLSSFNTHSVCDSCNGAIKVVMRIFGGTGQSARDALEADNMTDAARCNPESARDAKPALITKAAACQAVRDTFAKSSVRWSGAVCSYVDFTIAAIEGLEVERG